MGEPARYPRNSHGAQKNTRKHKPAHSRTLFKDGHIPLSLWAVIMLNNAWRSLLQPEQAVLPGGTAFRITLPVWARHYLFLPG